MATQAQIGRALDKLMAREWRLMRVERWRKLMKHETDQLGKIHDAQQRLVQMNSDIVHELVKPKRKSPADLCRDLAAEISRQIGDIESERFAILASAAVSEAHELAEELRELASEYEHAQFPPRPLKD